MRHTIVQLAIAILLFILPMTALAQPETRWFYVGVDFTTAHHTGNQTAFLYDENYNQFPQSSLNDKTSQINLDQWLGRTGTNHAWLLGISDIQVILRDDVTEEEEDVTDTPAFTEMVHHFVTEYWQAQDAQTTRQATDPCGLIRPIGAGSELTPALFIDDYAFDFYDKGFLGGWRWHWANPADVEIGEDESVYLRIVLSVHLTNAQAYTNTNVAWLHANDNGACMPDLCVANGSSTATSPQYTAASAGRIVLAMPHIHDHGTEVRLMRLVSGNPTTVKTFTVSNDYNHPAGHGCSDVSWHNNHTTPATAHLPVGGLETWRPGGSGPTFSSGDKFYCEGDFNNPHQGGIDNMVIVVIFTAAN